MRDLVLLAGRLLAYASLAALWYAIFSVFLDKMLPRLRYLNPRASGGDAIGIDPPCLSPECDFSAFWPAGLLARAHRFATIYEPNLFLAFQRQILNAAMQRDAFFYPPPALLLSAVISYLPFETGFFVWTAIFIAAAVWLLRKARFSYAVIAVALLSPAALWNIELGQYGIITGALLVAGLTLSGSSPRLSGLVLGLFIFKPQLAVVAPAALLAGRQDRTLLVGAGCVATILLITFGAFGWPVWKNYAAAGLAESVQVLNVGSGLSLYENFGVSVFWMIRSFGGGLPVSYAAQALVSVACMAACRPVWTAGRFFPLERVAMSVLLATLAMPYGYTDDMVGYAIVLTALAESRGWRIDILDAFLWLWPALCPVIGARTGLVLTPLVVAVAAGRVVWRAHLPAACGMVTGGGGLRVLWSKARFWSRRRHGGS